MTAALLSTTREVATPITLEATTAAVAATRVTTFLRAQAQWLCRGLSHSSDRVAVDIVLGAHDRSHDRWLGLIHHVSELLSDDVADEIAILYAYMGRIAGSLHNGATERLCPQVARSVRELLAERLNDRTEAVVERLWQAAAEA